MIKPIQKLIINHKKKRKEKFIKFLLIILLIFFNIESIKIIFFHLFNISFNDYLNIYIVTHKDFNNKLNNPYYKIICDNKTQLQKKYQIKIIETYKNNELYSKKRGYSEGSKIYYIWKKYKKNKIVSKYVGFAHYSRVFIFGNQFPNLDKIFTKYDAIIKKKSRLKFSVKTHFAKKHFQKFLDEIEEIIKEKFKEYYPQTQKTLNGNFLSFCNIFIMKKEDFIKYGKFVFGVLLEFDRRHNIKNDKDIQNLIVSEIKRTGKRANLRYQCRLEGFLMERISSIFYYYKFKKIFYIRVKSQ